MTTFALETKLNSMNQKSRQIALLSDMEVWAKKIKKETAWWRNKVDSVFKKELIEGCSAPKDVTFSLRSDVDFALDELLDYIETAKNDLEL